ncbi:hypothetical protein LTS18_007473 [Coniosporium uncinatum]|uniref:Uncharacterized protein n=1 Tax=Coniosporium uncinatum TaxID=93489 RepID=A0ACC3D2I0_9PEZI|nr:hypothetical protein LTS18_007473 [Coniosporium uncinatum]
MIPPSDQPALRELGQELIHVADTVDRVIAGNRTYAKQLWIGCADSRVPETTICLCKPGELFVHRNIANVVQPGDVNSSSVIEYSVAHLKVKKIIVCGHTECGGANAALGDADLGETLNTWLESVRALRRKHIDELNKLPSDDARANRLAELNAENSIGTLRRNPVVADAMKERDLEIHGFIYDIPAARLLILDVASRQPL